MVDEMEDLLAMVWNTDFHFVLFELLVDFCLLGWSGRSVMRTREEKRKSAWTVECHTSSARQL